MNDKWKITDLDEVVRRHVQNMTTRTDVLDFIASVSEEQHQIFDFEEAEKRIREIDAQIVKLLDLYQIGSIPMETIKDRVNALHTEKETLQKLIRENSHTPEIENFLAAIDAYKAGFHSGDTDAQRLFLSSLIQHITIDGQSVNIKWRI